MLFEVCNGVSILKLVKSGTILIATICKLIQRQNTLFFANSFLLTRLPHRVGVESDEAGFLDFLIILAQALFP